MSFASAYDKLLAYEGKYSDSPIDKGGETYKGISRVHWSSWAGWKVIDSLKGPGFPGNLAGNQELEGHVKIFYRVYFWDAGKLDYIPTMLAEEVFEQGVNFGLQIGIKHLQRAVSLIGGKPLAADGRAGTETVGATCELSEGRQVLALKVLNILAGMRYVELVEKDAGQRGNLEGWLKRVEV